jgi:exonuclease SbcC
MRLRSVTIKNFRPFPLERETRFDLDHSVVLAYGGNGSGKSSLFDAIELGLSGSIKRLEVYGAQSRFLINARHPDDIAIVRLEALRDLEVFRPTIEIRPGTPIVAPPAILHRHDVDLFYHTTYLLQSDLRRLVLANSESLGEIITRLVVDEDVAVLFRGLGDANVSRNDSSYQRARFAIEELQRQLVTVVGEIKYQESSMASIQDSRISLEEVATNIMAIGEALDMSVPKSQLSSLHNILALARKMDEVLQQQLSAAIADQSGAERSLSICSTLKSEQSRLEPTRSKIDQRLANLRRTKKQLLETRSKIKDASAELRKHNSQAGLTESFPTLIKLLEDAAAVSQSGVCPVCDRPFPNLLGHIRQKLSRLEKQQTEGQKVINQIQMRLDSLKDAEGTFKESRETQEQQLTESKEEFESYQRRLSTFISRYPGQSGPAKNLEQIERQERRRLQTLSETHARLVGLVESVSEIQSKILAATIGISRQKEALETLELRRKNLQEAIDHKQAAFDRLSFFIDATQETRRRLSELIENLLAEFVQGRARIAFEDLFRRIARHPYFKVTIPSSQVRYHKPEVSWVAAHGKNFYPGGAVFSQGQLNACGLALFLALATTQSNHLGILLLDDPVQSMDEVHIEEFANVLKSIKDVLGWQIVIGVHEQSLFNYLKRVLYPTESKQSLIAYTLVTSQDGSKIASEEKFGFNSKAFSHLPTNSAA